MILTSLKEGSPELGIEPVRIASYVDLERSWANLRGELEAVLGNPDILEQDQLLVLVDMLSIELKAFIYEELLRCKKTFDCESICSSRTLCCCPYPVYTQIAQVSRGLSIHSEKLDVGILEVNAFLSDYADLMQKTQKLKGVTGKEISRYANQGMEIAMAINYIQQAKEALREGSLELSLKRDIQLALSRLEDISREVNLVDLRNRLKESVDLESLEYVEQRLILLLVASISTASAFRLTCKTLYELPDFEMLSFAKAEHRLLELRAFVLALGYEEILVHLPKKEENKCCIEQLLASEQVKSLGDHPRLESLKHHHEVLHNLMASVDIGNEEKIQRIRDMNAFLREELEWLEERLRSHG